MPASKAGRSTYTEVPWRPRSVAVAYNWGIDDPSRDSADRSAQIEVLIKKYDMVRRELLFYMSQYKSGVKYINYGIIAAVAIASLAVGRAHELQLVNSRLFWLVTAFSVTTFVGYVASDVLESQYSLIALAARASSLERMINRAVGAKLLLWETHIVDKFFGEGSSPQNILRPSAWIQFFWAFFVGFALFFPHGLIIYKMWCNSAYTELQPIFYCFSIALIVYSVITAVFILLASIEVLLRMRLWAHKSVEDVLREQGVDI